MATSYAQWSVTDLEKEKVRIEKAIEKKSGEEKIRVRAKVTAFAKKSGFSLEELVDAEVPSTRAAASTKADTGKRTGSRVSKAKGKKIPPKYVHPTDAGLTWTGRGRTPLWMVEFEKAGKKRDQFLIK